MKRYTVGYVAHDPAVHTRYLGPSLITLKGEFDELSTSSLRCPATNYNTMLDQCQTPYLILTHQDVTFQPDLLEALDRTIAARPDFGALGMVGVDVCHQYLWSNPGCIHNVDTFDCCFIVVRKDLGVRFDDATFDELHQYVEDYCGQVTRKFNKLCHTILTTGLQHHAATYNVRGAAWGKWHEYHRKLLQKWPDIQTT